MAAPFQNYGGTLLANVTARNNFSTYVSEAILERSAFLKSGAIVRNSLLDATSGGTKITVPEFNKIAPTEEILAGTNNWGTSSNGYLTPQNITSQTQTATICHRAFAYAVDDLAVLAAGEDPTGDIRNQLADAINKLNNARLFSHLSGLFKTALAANALDVAKGASGTALEANFLTASTIARARNLLGERGEDLDILIVHPTVAYYLYQVGMLTFSTSALSTGGAVTWGGGGVGVGAKAVGEFAGCTVVVDSAVNTVAPSSSSGHQKEFFCYLTTSGTILEGQQSALRIEAERNILSKQEVISVDYHSAYHIMGTNYGGADNPTNAVLATAGSWTATYDVDLIPLVQLTVNSPLDTSTYS